MILSILYSHFNFNFLDFSRWCVSYFISLCHIYHLSTVMDV